MHIVSKEQLESLRRRYPQGSRVCLDSMEGESKMAPGLKGKVSLVDDAGQIHMDWENGSGLALISGVDKFHKVSGPEKEKRPKGELSR